MRAGESQGKPIILSAMKIFQKKIERDELGWVCARIQNDNFYGVAKDNWIVVRNSGNYWPCGKLSIKVITGQKKFPEIKVKSILHRHLLKFWGKRNLKKRDPGRVEIFKRKKDYTKEWMKYETSYTYKVVNEEGKLMRHRKMADIIRKLMNLIKKIQENIFRYELFGCRASAKADPPLAEKSGSAFSAGRIRFVFWMCYIKLKKNMIQIDCRARELCPARKRFRFGWKISPQNGFENILCQSKFLKVGKVGKSGKNKKKLDTHFWKSFEKT